MKRYENHFSDKISEELEKYIIHCRGDSPAFGPVRLKDYFLSACLWQTGSRRD
ncbi:MAG: hypothetical protein U9R41_04295 [Candidatus Marinimicrobia bacterium]|nr:hypothetical protein [Candidatus Neomarinimicrobiota bacterium]